ncbi:hypothetical protein CRENBAI_001788 [Crenichthys baileyi]|uniref:Uncharacterized protein n=1 Tax=Crenichthys baileyi TaxID=28760 RepID=A0AAV9SPS3_9TELE
MDVGELRKEEVGQELHLLPDDEKEDRVMLLQKQALYFVAASSLHLQQFSSPCPCDRMRVQLLSAMSRKDGELEGRLDNLLSRIAMETQEIKELEQQLTSGQILANEALQKDLEEVICGLQEYLRGMRQQAWRSQLQVHVLQTENQSLQRLLEDAQRHCRQLDDTQQEELSALWTEAHALSHRQVELKEGLQQLKEELTQQDGNQRLQVQLDQSKSQLNQSKTQLERFTVGLSELQENQRALKDKVSSKDLLFGSIEQLEKSTQGNLTSRQELQQGQNQTVEQDSDWELKEELQRLRDHLLRSHSRTGLVQLNLAPSLASRGTQDSGLGLQYLSSPDRGQPQQQDGLPAGGESVSGVEIPPTPPNPSEGVSAGISEAQGPPMGLSRLLCGPPTGGAAQCCSIKHHRDKGSRCVSECVHKVEAKKKLQRSLRRHRSVLQVCDELECLEETLLQRRAELRQADRLLLEAQSCRQTARRTADRLQHRLEDSATCLLEATQRLRKLQEDAEQLRRKREVEKPRSRQKELHRLGSKIHRSPRRPTDLLSDCQGAQEHLDPLTCQEEQRLVLRKEELQAAEDRVMELREEEQRLLSIIKDLFEQQEALFIERRSTGSSVKEEEQRLIRVKAELTSHQTELKQILQEVLVEQEVMEEVKTKCSQTVQQLHRKQEELQKMRENFNKMKGDVDDKRKELAELQQEVASYKEDAASSLKDMRRQRTALQEVQQELSRRKEERSTLQEQCTHLEARRRHADRCLSVLEAELSKKKEELRPTQSFKEGVVR